jgi:hypothetical protein
MGRITAINISESGVDMLSGLKMHLTGNFYPPHTPEFAPLCAKAIEEYNDHIYEIELLDDFSSLEDEYIIPEGVEFRGSRYMTLVEVIQAFKLEPFLETLEEEE